MAAVADELSPIVTGIVYCNTIAFCRDVYELRHAREWTETLTQWCERQPEMVAHNGLCLVHRAEIMELQGAWDEALDEARQAAERFTRGVLNELACGAALYRQGEIHRMRGEYAAAEEVYKRASRCGYEAQPGLGLLRLAEGKAWAAAGAIRRVVGETTASLLRARLLPAYIEIMLAVRGSDEARAASRELDEIAAGHGAEALGAMAAQARGNVALNDGDASAALAPLRAALTVWQELAARYEMARTRSSIGLACRELRDEDTAVLELEAAREIFSELGARPDLARVDAFLRRASSPGAYGLSERELEVYASPRQDGAIARSPPCLSSASTPSLATCRTSSTSSAFPRARRPARSPSRISLFDRLAWSEMTTRCIGAELVDPVDATVAMRPYRQCD